MHPETLRALNRFVNQLAALSLLVLMAAPCVAATNSAPAAEQLLPDDTLLMFTIPDCGKAREVWGKLPMAQLWSDPVMKPARDKFTARMQEELLTPLERDLGIKVNDYLSLARGQLTMALTLNGWDGGENGRPGALLIVDTRDKQPQLDKFLADFRKKWTDAGKSLQTEKIRELEFFSVTISSNDVPNSLRKLLPGPSQVREIGDGKDAPPKEGDGQVRITFGRAGALFIAGNTLAPIERVVAKLGGSPAPVLADVDHFQACQGALFREANAFGWMNAKQLVAPLTKVSEKRAQAAVEAPDPMASIKPEKILNATGLSALRSAAFAFQDSPEGPLLQFHLAVPEADRRGLLKVLIGEAKEVVPPAFIPADTMRFTRWRMDGQKAWDTLTATMNEISPLIMDQFNYYANTADEAGKATDEKFDIRRQVIGNLADDLIFYVKKPKGTSVAELANPAHVTVIGSKNPAEMVGALKVLFAAIAQGKPPEEREFLGRKIYSVSAVAGLDPSTQTGRKLVLTQSGGYVVVSSDEAAIEEFLRSSETQGQSLRELNGFPTAAARVTGPGTSFFGFENQLEARRSAFELMKRSLSDTNAPESGLTPVQESFGFELPESSLREWLDESLLPSFDSIAKYYGFVVYGGSANVDGLTLKLFFPTPTPPKK
jgi:hypothetical protein